VSANGQSRAPEFFQREGRHKVGFITGNAQSEYAVDAAQNG